MYEYAEVQMPEWMINIATPEGVEESFRDEQDHYISNIKSLILSKAQVNDYDKENNEDKKFVTPKEKAEDVVKMSRWPWIHYHAPRTGINSKEEFVWIEKAIETDLKKEKNIILQLDRVAELLGGEMQRKTIKKRKPYMAVFNYEDFIDLF